MNTSLIHILLFTKIYFEPFSKFSSQEDFVKRNCTFTNCIVTSNINYFGNESSQMKKFDAVFFDGRYIDRFNVSALCHDRSEYQKFVFTATEPSDIYPVYDKNFENFFNWTATYKLDSDIPIPYISVRNKIDEVVGPKRKMYWETDFEELPEKFSAFLRIKTKAAAWFAAECTTPSKSENYIKHLDESLRAYGYSVDIFGKCGRLNATRWTLLKQMSKNYFFYLAFENIFADDYVSEKVLTALRKHTVPVVFGGANYSRFLPPGSYLNALEHTPEELSFIMRQAIWNPALYGQFFRWRSHYSFKRGDSSYVCDICAALNNKTLVATKTVYHRFRRWWNKNWFKM